MATTQQKFRDYWETEPNNRVINPSNTTNSEAFYINLPYLGDAHDYQLRRIFLREGIPIRIYRRSNSLRDFLRPKRGEYQKCIWDDCPTRRNEKCFLKNVVYKLTCRPCNQSYIGSTARALHERIRYHTSRWTGSTVHHHLKICGRGRANIDVFILSHECDAINTRLAEARIIRKENPSLNERDEEGLASLIFW